MKTLLFQGDSITDCCRTGIMDGATLGLGYPNLIAAQLMGDDPAAGWKVINKGISGNRVVDLYARWKIDALNLNPDIISILIGVNDTWHEQGGNGVEVDRYEQVYRMLLQWTRKVLPNVKFILMEPFVLPFGAVNESWLAEIDQRRDIVRTLAEEFDAVFIPLQKHFNDALKLAPQEYWLKDGVHPTTAGHRLIQKVWLEAAADLIK